MKRMKKMHLYLNAIITRFILIFYGSLILECKSIVLFYFRKNRKAESSKLIVNFDTYLDKIFDEMHLENPNFDNLDAVRTIMWAHFRTYTLLYYNIVIEAKVK